MKNKDILTGFDIELDKNAVNIGISGCPAFLPAEKCYWLNKAYLQLIMRKFTGNNTLQAGFEGGVKRIFDLEKLIKTDYSLGDGDDLLPDENKTLLFNSNSNTLTINDFTESKVRLLFITAVLRFGNQSTTISLIEHKDADKFLKTYNNNPWIETPVAVVRDNKIVIYLDTESMVAPYRVDLTYVKYPSTIDYTTPETDIIEIPEYMWNEVISLATLLALDNIESQRLEGNSELNKLSE